VANLRFPGPTDLVTATDSTGANTMTTTASTSWPTSHLSAAATAFETLTCEPEPVLALDCDALGDGLGLPAGTLSLARLRDWMLDNPTAHDARDQVWREVLTRARGTGPQAGAWLIGAVGLAMPALLSHARALGDGFRGDPDDLDNEILTGFLAALRGEMDLSRPAPYARLTFGAWRAGRDARLQEAIYVPTPDVPSSPGPREPRNPGHHTDLLVARAVELGLLDAGDAAAWIEERLAGHPVEYLADQMGLSTGCLRMRLVRADTVLAHALGDGLLSGPVSVISKAGTRKAAFHRAKTRAARATISTRRNAAAPVR
jgi:hypothetical protein